MSGVDRLGDRAFYLGTSSPGFAKPYEATELYLVKAPHMLACFVPGGCDDPTTMGQVRAAGEKAPARISG